MSTYNNILVEHKDGICYITINRADKMNALNIELIQEIGQAVKGMEEDKNIAGAILTGAGDKAFAAGADIAEFASFSVDEANEMSAGGQDVFNSIEHASKPVIAAVNGFALGGGCELAMACHMRVASPNARFGQPEVNLGLIPGYGGTQRLIQLIGKGKAVELLLTADMIKAPQALELGLVNHVVESDELIAKCAEIINKIGTKGPVAIAKTIQCINAYYEDGENGLEYEIEQFASCFGTQDFKEGTQAFLNKRPAEFKGN